MNAKFTKQNLLDSSPCRDGLAFAQSCDFDFKKIYETCDRGDWLIWLLRKSKAIDKKQAVQIAIVCAEHVLEIYEKKNPNDKRPRQAIESAAAWVLNPTEENQELCRKAADAAAYAAAYAADAADAAAYAAYAAADAAAYAADARLSERKWQANKIREIIPNPFQ